MGQEARSFDLEGATRRAPGGADRGVMVLAPLTLPRFLIQRNVAGPWQVADDA